MPDYEAARVTLKTDHWPENYNISYARFVDNLALDGHLDREYLRNYADKIYDGKFAPPDIWRYLTRNDIENYDANYRTFESQFKLNRVLAWCSGETDPDFGNTCNLGPRSRDDKIRRSLEYLTRGGMPEGFLTVYGSEQGHRGWLLQSFVRDLQLLVVTLKNVGKRSVSLGNFQVTEVGDRSLRPRDKTDEMANNITGTSKRLYPPSTLEPGGQIVIPLRMQFVSDDVHSATYNTAYRTVVDTLVARLHLLKRVAMVNDQGDEGPNPLFYKAGSSFDNGKEPTFIDRFDFGPSWVISSITVDGRELDVRRHDDRNFFMQSGMEAGSCPTVFSYRPRYDLWERERQILTRYSSKEREGTDTLRLRHFEGRVKIVELESETTVVKKVVLILKRGAIKRRFSATDQALKAGGQLVLQHNQEMEIHFPVTADQLKGASAYLEITGYYIPFSSFVEDKLQSSHLPGG